MSLDYALYQLMLAVETLAASPEPIQRRMEWAFLCLHTLVPDDFPEGELRGQFRAVQEAMTRVEGVGGEGSIAASAKAMSDSEASEIAKVIVALFAEIAKRDPLGEYHPERPD